MVYNIVVGAGGAAGCQYSTSSCNRGQSGQQSSFGAIVALFLGIRWVINFMRYLRRYGALNHAADRLGLSKQECEFILAAATTMDEKQDPFFLMFKPELYESTIRRYLNHLSGKERIAAVDMAGRIKAKVFAKAESAPRGIKQRADREILVRIDHPRKMRPIAIAKRKARVNEESAGLAITTPAAN